MVYALTHTPEASILHFLAHYDKLWFSSFDKFIDHLDWMKVNFHYCYMHNLPEDVRPPFPYLVSVLSLLSCFLLFFISKLLSPFIFKAYNALKESDKEKWDVKFVSALHAAFVFQGAVRCLIAGGGLFFNSNESLLGYQNLVCGYYTDLSRFYMAITFGYMFYDFWVCIRAYGFTLEGIFPSLVIHHFNIIISFLLALKFGMGHYYTLSFMTNEISQPFLHLSWFLIKSKVPQMHPISIINGLCLVLTFLGSRFVFNLVIFVHFVANTLSFDPTICLGVGTWTCFIHVACNWHWCWLMVLQIRDMIVKKKPTEKANPPTTSLEEKKKSIIIYSSTHINN
ncbi:hypothetical protein FDP41_013657 [Naegleria fowleri]|uniref:TLC domain-containing protein n=1 Tax=Naegleria fowleri TaxID=5763 RepID=A0A6A5BQV5_NAEFO|nr:uncharacterized protein FDP41_013657 [Naegleria fowleri]KAF0980443.1 hypothetical protein FDP41_013657 [Naegleria fowleri]